MSLIIKEHRTAKLTSVPYVWQLKLYPCLCKKGWGWYNPFVIAAVCGVTSVVRTLLQRPNKHTRYTLFNSVFDSAGVKPSCYCCVTACTGPTSPSLLCSQGTLLQACPWRVAIITTVFCNRFQSNPLSNTWTVRIDGREGPIMIRAYTCEKPLWVLKNSFWKSSIIGAAMS